MIAKANQKHLLHVFSSFEVGGAQARFCEIANWLGPNYHHTIVALDENFECANRLDGEVSWESVSVKVHKSRGIDLGNLVRFRRLLKEMHPAILVSYGWGAVEWGLVNRYWPIAPHIHLEDGFGPEESETVQLRRRVYLRRIAFGQHTRIIVPSRTLWNVATNYWKVAPSRLSLIPN